MISLKLNLDPSTDVSIAVYPQNYTKNKGKGSPYSITKRIGSRSWFRSLAVSVQVMRVINPTMGCHYFPPGLQLPPQPCQFFCCLVNRGTMGMNSLLKTVIRQRRDCDLNPAGPSAPESSSLTTRLSSHPQNYIQYVFLWFYSQNWFAGRRRAYIGLFPCI